jgi:hypothetical protein
VCLRKLRGRTIKFFGWSALELGRSHSPAYSNAPKA